MHNFTQQKPIIPPLMLWQILLLCFIAGILLTVSVSLAIILCIAIVLFSPYPLLTTIRLPTVILFICCGWAYTELRTPDPAPIPPWLQLHMQQTAHDKKQRVLVFATVQEVIPLSPQTARVILTHITPLPHVVTTANNLPAHAQLTKLPTVEPPIADNNEQYLGKVLWTWKAPIDTKNTPEGLLPEHKRPVAGQRIALAARVMPLTGMVNPGTLDTESFWQTQNVWLRLTAYNKLGFTVISPAPWWQSLRSRLYQQCLAALPTVSLIPQSDDSTLALNHPAITQGATLIPALLFGDKSTISLTNKELIAKSTLAHSLSLSGLHLGYMITFGMCAAWALVQIAPRMLMRIPFANLSAYCSLPLALGYLWLGNAPVSLQRSFLMLAFWVLIFVIHRPKVFLDGLFAAIAVLLFINPLALFDLSLQLSALSIVVIALCIPFAQHIAAITLTPCSAGNSKKHTAVATQNNWKSNLFQIFWISFCIQLILSPLVVRAFGTLGLWFPLNLIWLPVLGAVVMPFAFLGLLLSAMHMPVLAAATFSIAAAPCDALLWLLNYLDSLTILWSPAALRLHPISIAGFWLLCISTPAIAVRIIYYYKQFRSHLALSQNNRNIYSTTLPCIPASLLTGLFAGLVLLISPLLYAAAFTPAQGVHIRVLDVGAAQAILIEWNLEKNKGRALIDGGGVYDSGFNAGKSIVLPTITDNAAPHIDVAINSHPDSDHLGGLLPILQYTKPKTYITNGESPSEQLAKQEAEIMQQRGIKKVVVAQGDTIHLAPDLQLQVMWPPPNTPKENKRNDNSLVLRLMWNNIPLAVFCGDIERKTATLLAETASQQLMAKLLIAPHHGYNSSYSPALYNAVSPVAVIESSSTSTLQPFEKNKIHQYFSAKNIPLYSTATMGQITAHFATPNTTPAITTARTQHIIPIGNNIMGSKVNATRQQTP